ncbi:MAG: hypothetical protein PHD54_15855 [Desulfuromonadaceae bacterium]|nr:hypothetical protein [Desulfuromonadaceae bacterium]
MYITDSIPLPRTGTPRAALSAPAPGMPVPLDLLQISEIARQKIEQLQQGNQALEQSLIQSRQAARNAATDRVKYVKAYLKILVSMSPAGDRAAASEAARMAREIKSAVTDFKRSIAYGEESGIRTEIAGFAGVAGDALKIAQGMLQSYLQRRSLKQKGGHYLEIEIGNAVSSVRETIHETLNLKEYPIADAQTR